MSHPQPCRKGVALPWSHLGVSLVALTLLACNGNDPPKPQPGPAPTLTTATPADQTRGVALTTTVVAGFSTGMDALTFTAASFTLSQAGLVVPGAIVNGPGNAATLTPSNPRTPGLLYSAALTTGIRDLEGRPLAAPITWTFTTAPAVVVTPPAVVSTLPLANATGVGLNTRIDATFSEAIDPLTVTAATFTLSQGGTVLPGSLVDSGKVVAFTPAVPLSPNTLFSAKLSTGVKDLQGHALAAPVAWTFTTGASAQTTPPTVVSTLPLANATGVGLNTQIAATFSEAIDPLTLTTSTFTVKQGTTPVDGTLAFGPIGTTATFTPAGPLTAGTTYGATLTTGVKDLEGNPLATADAWTFTTGTAAAKGPAVVNLGNAGNYAILAQAAISTVPSSAITGDIGLSPAAASFLTGFSLTADASNVFATSPQITGKAFAANDAVPTPANLTTAVGDMLTAYTDAATRPTPDFLNLGSGDLGGLTLAPGLYLWTSSVTVPTDVVISGGANDIWIFQTTGDLSESGARNVTLSGGAQAKNIFWQVAGQVTLGPGAHFEGILLCKTQVTLQTQATMNGRILAQTLVALQQATVTVPR